MTETRRDEITINNQQITLILSPLLAERCPPELPDDEFSSLLAVEEEEAAEIDDEFSSLPRVDKEEEEADKIDDPDLETVWEAEEDEGREDGVLHAMDVCNCTMY